jgi:preprotein translocase subunit SecG
MIAILLILHILVALFLVIAILLQSGQAGGLSGAFGGGGSQTLFGGRGAATFLSKATTYLGAAFLLISLLLAFAQAHKTGGARTEGRNVVREALQPTSRTPEEAPANQPTEGLPVPPDEGGAPAPSPDAGSAPQPSGAGGH